MDNCPNQTVLCGPEEPIRQAMTTLTARGAICTFLPFSRGYHSPLYQPVCDYLREPARRVPVKTPATAIYSCSTARPFPADPEEIRTLAIDQYARTVRFRETVEGLYEEGVRLFIEVGPRGNLCSFVHDTLGKREHEAVAMDLATEHGITRLNRSLGLLAAHGVALNLDPVYQNRQSSRKTASATASKLPSLRLDMSLPRLKLSDDTAATVRAQAASARSASTPATPDGNGGFSDTTTDRANRVPRMSARPGTDHKSSVVNAYLHTMEEMVGAEGSIMGAFVDAHRKGTGAGTGLADLPAIIRAGVDPLSPSIHSDHRLRFALCIENGPVDHDAWSRAVAPSEKSRAQSSMTATPGELTSMKDAAYLLWRDVYGCRIGHGECVVESYQSSRAVVRTHGGERAARVAVTRVGPLALAVARDSAGGEEGIGLHAQVDSAAVPGEPLLSDTERRMVTTAATMDSQSPWLAIAGMMKRAAMAALGRPTTHGLFLRSLDPGSGSATIHYESGGERVTLTAFAGRIETILCALAVY
jgi:hypothetical protein